MNAVKKLGAFLTKNHFNPLRLIGIAADLNRRSGAVQDNAVNE
jgi:hypothetical protein